MSLNVYIRRRNTIKVMSVDEIYDVFFWDNGFRIQKACKRINIFKDIFKDTLMKIMKVRFNRMIWYVIMNEGRCFKTRLCIFLAYIIYIYFEQRQYEKLEQWVWLFLNWIIENILFNCNIVTKRKKNNTA